jgi:hypothetical protein
MPIDSESWGSYIGGVVLVDSSMLVDCRARGVDCRVYGFGFLVSSFEFQVFKILIISKYSAGVLQDDSEECSLSFLSSILFNPLRIICNLVKR